MKTRRRLLTLAMVILLLLGILPVQAWSVEFKDVTEESDQEALDILTATALIDNIEFEAFSADSKDLRNQMGKRMAYLLLGDNAARWMDMQWWYGTAEKDAWAKGFVQYVFGDVPGGFEELKNVDYMKWLLVRLGYGAGVGRFTGLPWDLEGDANQFYKAATAANNFGTLPVTGPTIGTGTDRYMALEEKDIDRSLRYYNYGDDVFFQNVTMLSRVVEGQNTGTAYPAGLKIAQSALKKVAQWNAGLTMVTADCAARLTREQANALANDGTEELLLKTRTEDDAVVVLITPKGGTPSEDMEAEIVLPAQGSLLPNVLICQDGRPLANTVIDVAANGYSAKTRVPMGKETVFTLSAAKENIQDGDFYDLYLQAREAAGATDITAIDFTEKDGTDLPFNGRVQVTLGEKFEAKKAAVLTCQMANGPDWFDPISNLGYAYNPRSYGAGEMDLHQ